jgi:hypothetical protein
MCVYVYDNDENECSWSCTSCGSHDCSQRNTSKDCLSCAGRTEPQELDEAAQESIINKELEGPDDICHKCSGAGDIFKCRRCEKNTICSHRKMSSNFLCQDCAIYLQGVKTRPCRNCRKPFDLKTRICGWTCSGCGIGKCKNQHERDSDECSACRKRRYIALQLCHVCEGPSNAEGECKWTCKKCSLRGCTLAQTGADVCDNCVAEERRVERERLEKQRQELKRQERKREQERREQEKKRERERKELERKKEQEEDEEWYRSLRERLRQENAKTASVAPPVGNLSSLQVSGHQTVTPWSRSEWQAMGNVSWCRSGTGGNSRSQYTYGTSSWGLHSAPGRGICGRCIGRRHTASSNDVERCRCFESDRIYES